MTVKQTFKTEAGVSKNIARSRNVWYISFCFREDFLVIEGLFYAYVHIDEVRQA